MIFKWLFYVVVVVVVKLTFSRRNKYFIKSDILFPIKSNQIKWNLFNGKVCTFPDQNSLLLLSFISIRKIFNGINQAFIVLFYFFCCESVFKFLFEQFTAKGCINLFMLSFLWAMYSAMIVWWRIFS